MRIPRFKLEQSNEILLSPHGGLVAVGQIVHKFTTFDKDFKSAAHQRHGVPHSDIAMAYLGLLCIGKNDFEAINGVKDDDFFKRALGIKQMPSEATLRQRFDERARSFVDVVDKVNVDLLVNASRPITPTHGNLVALDIDAMPMDNSGTKKEGISFSYKGFVGYTPLMAYLGEEGWCLGAELRPGSQHCQDEFGYFLDRVLPRAKHLLLGSGNRLLVRLDGGHDARPNLARFIDEEVDFLIKWNPRTVKRSFWREYVDKEGIAWEEVRPGYRVAHFSITVTYKGKGRQHQFRRIMRLAEITQDSKGQILLVPDIKIEGWWTSLDLPEKEIIKLYAERGTSEQFHSEFKTDMDIERLPSGKFDTNDLVLTFAALAYNILRMIGQMGMLGELAPVRHRAKRRRIRTVIQELIYLATRIVRSGRRWKLVFGKVCAGFAALENVYEQLTPG